MKQLLETIVKGIVNEPSSVIVVERDSVDFPGLIILEIEVEQSDKGILIGRRGRTINAIRDLITISAIRNDKRVKVLVKEDGRDAEGKKEEVYVEPKASAEVEDILNDEI